VPEVKINCDRVIPNLEIKELEHAKDLIKNDYLDMHDTDEYPFYQVIKKLLYAFGDVFETDSGTVIFMHEFLKKWLINLIKILNECEVKKVLEHLFSFEYAKYFKYKKIKSKNKINIVDNMNGIGDIGIFSEESQIEVGGYKISKDSKGSFMDVESIMSEFEVNTKQMVNNNLNSFNDVINTCDNNKKNLYEELLDYDEDMEEEKKTKTDNFENIFEDKNDSYYENLMFQDMRTENMKEHEYLYYINCRTSSFFTKNKKILTYINGNNSYNELSILI